MAKNKTLGISSPIQNIKILEQQQKDFRTTNMLGQNKKPLKKSNTHRVFASLLKLIKVWLQYNHKRYSFMLGQQILRKLENCDRTGE